MFKDDARKIARDDPIGLIDNLTEAHIGADAGEQIHIYRRQILFAAYQFNHAAERGADILQQIRADADGHFIAGAGEVIGGRTRRGEARRPDCRRIPSAGARRGSTSA